MIGNPHALAIATSGIIVGSSIGHSTEGYLVTVSEYTPPPQPQPPAPDSAGGGGGAMGEYKRVVVTVYAYGEKFISTHIVDMNTKVSVEDVEIFDSGEGIVEVSIRNVENEKDIL